MKPQPQEVDGRAASTTSSFFKRTSAALHPRAFFRLSNLSAVSRESRMWGVKPKQDHEVEDQTKEELGELMSNDPNVKKMGEATGTIIRQPKEFPPDEDVVKAKEARLAMLAKKEKSKKKKKTLAILGALLLVLGVVSAAAVLATGGDEKEVNAGNNALPTTAPSLSPTESPTLAPTPTPFRITSDADQEALCKAIEESGEFNFADSDNVYVSCQTDAISVFGCKGDGNLIAGNNFCGLIAGANACPCDAGQIIDATSLEGGFAGICVNEINAENPLCVELEGDLAGLLAGVNDEVSKPF